MTYVFFDRISLLVGDIMIDMNKAMLAFKEFLSKYEDQDTLGFKLKVTHTYQVVNNAKVLVNKLNLSDEDKQLAELIALLHDIGRFEEISVLKKFDSVKFNHAEYGVKMLFEDGLIRNFITDDSYDDIIREAIFNHNLLDIKDVRDERTLLHVKIIRDADKLDNYRVKKDEKIEAIFPGIVKSLEEFLDSTISDKVYDTVMKCECVNIKDRTTLLDYWVCVLAFTFDLNFKESYEIVKENNYVNILIDRFEFNDYDTKIRMNKIGDLLNKFVDIKVMNRLDKARNFCREVKSLASMYDLPFFIVTDGASATNNNGCDAVRVARENHVKWELDNGEDPNHDWEKANS